jgi:hypothetical protein
LFTDWRSKGDVGVFYTGLLHFSFGALVVAHFITSGAACRCSSRCSAARGH